MTQQDKQLLLQDLCTRLPYGVKVLNMAEGVNEVCELDSILTSRKHKDKIFVFLTIPDDSVMAGIEMVKPYLRSMSSMTEEESAELSNIISEWFDKELFYLTEESFLRYALSKINYSINPLLFDWLNAHHFDYRGLIPKGLAIAITESNNPYKTLKT